MKPRILSYIRHLTRHDPYNVLCVVIIALIGGITTQLSLFRGDYLINGGDILIPLDPELAVYRNLYSWDERYGTGIYSPNMFAALIPDQIILLFFDELNLPLYLSQRVLLSVIFVMSGLAMYYLTTVAFDPSGNPSRRYVAGLVASLFYMFNPYTLQIGARPVFREISAYVACPLFLGLYIKGLSTKNWRYAAVIALSSIFFASSAVNPVYVAIELLPILIYFIFDVFSSYKDQQRVVWILKYSAVVFLCYFLVNMWWLLPTIFSISHEFEFGFSVSLMTWVSQKSAYSSIFNVLRMVSAPIWWGPIVPYASFYRTDALAIFLGLIIPILAFSSLFIKRKVTIFFASLGVLVIFLAKGNHPPFEFINSWLYENFPGFWVFRSTDHFIQLMALSYSFLIGVTISDRIFTSKEHPFETASKNRKTEKKRVYQGIIPINKTKVKSSLRLLTALMLIFMVLAYAWPFWRQSIIYPGEAGGGAGGSFYVKVPEYVYDAARWLKTDDDHFRILSLPPRADYVRYKWNNESMYDGCDVLLTLFDKPIVDWDYGSVSRELTFLIPHLMYTNSTERVDKLLGIMNVKYVLVHNDAVWLNISDYYDGRSYKNITREIVEKMISPHPLKSFGDLEFFENKYCVPHVYVAQSDWYVTGKTGSLRILGSIVSMKEFLPESAVFFLDSQNSPSSPLDSNGNIIIVQEAENDYFGNRDWTIIKATVDLGVFAGATTEYNDAYISYLIKVPCDGWYDVYAYVRWDDLRGALHSRIDWGDRSQGVRPHYASVGGTQEYKYQAIKLGNFSFTKGLHVIEFINEGRAGTQNYQNIDFFFLSKAGESTSKKVSIDFNKINPTKYVVSVNALEPFTLVLSEEYHPSWSAFVEDIELKGHYMVNGYANAWYVNQTGSYEIILEFTPQRFFYTGLYITIPAVCVCILSLHENRMTIWIYCLVKKRLTKIL